MSDVYSIEPPTTAKVILKTNFGNIDIELWTKEAPRACRNFIRLCLEKYYKGNVFFRIVKGFMIQTGDPLNDGKGGESIWKKDFGNEVHSRLKFSHRGIVAMANKGTPNTNSSQFFITMDKCPWLYTKHTIFGKVVGDTFFNALNVSELPVNDDDFPQTDTLPMITDTEVVINPFEDIKPRVKDISVEMPKKIVLSEKNAIEDDKKKQDNRLISFCDNESDEEQRRIKPIDNLFDPIESNKNEKRDIMPEVKDQDKRADNEDEESVSVEEGFDPGNMLKVSFEVDRKEEISKLKTEIQLMKQKMTLTPSQLLNDSLGSTQKLTPLQKHNEKYLQLKTKRLTKKEAFNKLDDFKANLSKAKLKSNHWMNNKLKFHVDSQKAYAIDQAKEIGKRTHGFT